MLPGVYEATKKNGTKYYRSNIHYNNKHISLGSFPSEGDAHAAYLEAGEILSSSHLQFEDVFAMKSFLSFEKLVVLFNFRDNHMYIKNPIYLRNNYFEYYLSPKDELKFDNDDLFYYSEHKIMRRKGHLFVSDYGMQVNILSRYGIHNYSVPGRDYLFANGDTNDYRYANIVLINRYHGVQKKLVKGKETYAVYLHLNGNHKIGSYPNESIAAIAYNKSVDLAKSYGVDKAFQTNYIDEYSSRDYADIYTKIKISPKFCNYLKSL